MDKVLKELLARTARWDECSHCKKTGELFQCEYCPVFECAKCLWEHDPEGIDPDKCHECIEREYQEWLKTKPPPSEFDLWRERNNLTTEGCKELTEMQRLGKIKW